MIVIAITKSPTKCIGISSFFKMIGDRDSDQKINDLTQPCYFHNGLINFLVVRLVLHCIYLSLSHFQPFYWFFLANLRFQNVMQCLCNQLWKLEVHFRYKIDPINRFFNFGNKSKFTLVADLSAGLQHCVFL